MLKPLFACTVVLLAVALAGNSAHAGPLDDAKAALAQKQFDKVDALLGKELLTGSPSAEALRVSFDAAEASGRVVTASARATALLKIAGDKDPQLLLRAARVADLAGDSQSALLRYLGYAHQAVAGTPEADEAFRYILRRGLYVEEYKKYVSLFGADARCWSIGKGLLARLIEAVDADRSLDLASFLMQSFPAPAKVQAVHEAVHSAASGFVYGKDPKDRWLKPLLVLVNSEPQSFGQVDQMFQQAAPALTPETRSHLILQLMGHCKGPISGGLVYQCGQDISAISVADAKVAAAREYLSFEPIYRSAGGEAYYWYLRSIGEEPQVFNAKASPLITGDALAQRVDALRAVSDSPQSIGHLREVVTWVSQNYLGADPPARAAFLQKNLDLLDSERLGDLATLKPELNFEQLVAQWAKGKPFVTVLAARVQQVQHYETQKNKAGVVGAMRDYLTAYPGTFSAQVVHEHFAGSTLLSAEEKLALLQETVGKGGYSKPMADLVAAMAQDAAWSKSAAYAAFKAALDKKPAGSDPAARAAVALATLPVNAAQPDGAVAETMKGFFAQFQGPAPGGDDQVTDARSLLLEQLWRVHGGHVGGNAAGVAAWADLWMPHMPAGDNWREAVQRLRERSDQAEMLKLLPVYAALARADRSHSDPAVWAQFAAMTAPAGMTDSPFVGVYDLMSTDQAASWLFSMRDVWTARHQYLADEWARVVSAPSAKFTSFDLPAQMVEHLHAWTGEQNFRPAPVLIKALWDAYLAAQQKPNAVPNSDVEVKVYSLWIHSGADHAKEAADFFAAWQQLLKARPVEQQATAYAQLFHYLNPPAKAGEDPSSPVSRHFLIFNVMKPLYEQVAPRLRDQAMVTINILGDVAAQAAAAPPPDPKSNASVDPKTYPQAFAAYNTAKADALAFARTLLDVLSDGASYDGGPGNVYGLADLLARDALARGDMPAVNSQLALYARYLGMESNSDGGWTALSSLLQALEAKGADEEAYAFIASLQKQAKLSDSVAKELLLAKARAATHIEGLIPVGPDDPAFDLYLAARSLALGDEQRAWELTLPKLKLLVQDWPGMDPSYVAWSVDQLRKQKMLKDGLAFSFNILLHENELDPGIAARILLGKADLYREMENYQAARIEYEGLKNNNRYNKTDAGSKAVFRLADLAIITKDYSAADALLERLVDSDTLQKQADAYYLYAKMDFQKGDFKEAHDNLKKVKERVLNHVEAALLEGELNLVLPGGLQNTEVNIGDPRLSTIVIPGRQLTLTLQDRNLSIARGGAAIPVVITAVKSGDIEHVRLLPSSSNKNLFTAVIATSLGAAHKDDLTLELRGDDVISYEIEPAFQKANDLHYAPKQLEARYDARLAASSGEILSEEEQEKRDLERQFQMRQAGASRRFDVARDGRTVRPGSRVFLQVTDFCRDVSDQPDKLSVNLKTGLGDTLGNVQLTETGPHTGVFRGAVATGLPAPRATASDTEAGKTPASIIETAPGPGWTSVADGRHGKWIEVDAMTSSDVASLTAVIPHLDQVKDVSVLGMLAQDYQELATYPARPGSARGGLMTDVAPEQNGDSVDQIQRYMKLATTSSFPQESPAFERALTPLKGQDGVWMTNRVRGAFYLPENRALELKWLSAPPPQDWLRCHVQIDGQDVLDGHNNSTLNVTGRIELAKGPHVYELLVRDYWKDSKVVVGYKTDAGTFEPLPSDWFSIRTHPELADYLRPRGKITIRGDQLRLDLDKPQRLRKLRIVFNDFLGTSVSVQSVGVTDAAGAAVIPAPSKGPDSGQQSLPISPGDTVTVSYDDQRPLHEDGKVLTSSLNSSYYNGRIVLAEEVITGPADQRRTDYLEARRCRIGDQLTVIVTDYDEDVSEQRDVVPVKVTTSSGESLVLNALETRINGDEFQHAHAGEFLAVLRIGDHAAKDTIKVRPGDRITVSYLDKENTDPGVPVERTYSISEAGSDTPQFVVYKTRVKMVEDDSAEARSRVKRLTGRDAKGVNLYKPQVIARRPDYVAHIGLAPAAPATRPGLGGPVAAVDAPLLFEVSCPEHALNAGSILEVTAVAESEVKAAAAEKRPPRALKVPAYVMGLEQLARIKGYPVQVESPSHRDERAMLRDGMFAGVIRLQIGSPGDAVDDLIISGQREFSRESAGPGETDAFWYKVPTMIVAGSDTVHLRVTDDNGRVIDTPVRLLSDGRLELLDTSYTVEEDSIHLGEKFHVKVTDPDHDVTDQRDAVKVRARSSSGADVMLTLNETLPHSGVFTGAIEPQFIGSGVGPATRPTTRPGGEALYANFGDDVTFEYVDDLTLESSAPVVVARQGKVLFGADGQVAVFTKKFKDPEIAVKTRFLTAEALFEMSKEHRKLGQNERAEEEVARGKRVLEEAIRDYPDTSLAAQGDYLLANLAQELANYQEAIGRYSNVISTFPDSDYAAQSQFKKALCFEKLQNYDEACEEYVKLTYIYPDSPLVADATVRLGNYYYKKQSYKIAGKIFYNFQQKNPSNKLAAEALFLSAECSYKLGDFKESSVLFQKAMDDYPDDKTVRPEAMYWLADSRVKLQDNVKAYQAFKKLTWDYPDTEWAKRARGRLTEDAFSRMQDDAQ